MYRLLASNNLKSGLHIRPRTSSIFSQHRVLQRKSFCVPTSQNLAQKGVVNHLVHKLNDSIKHYPAETIGALLLSDIGSIAAMYALLSAIGLEFSPDFAIAYGVSRPIRRLRLPFDLATASVISKLVPAVSRVRLMDLAPVMSLNGKDGNEKSSWIGKIMGGTRNIVNKYGAAYMIGSRLTGFGFVCILYTLIKNGMDVTPVLQYFGMEEVSSTLSSYAAAVVFSSLLYPATLGVSGYAAPIIAKYRRSLLP